MNKAFLFLLISLSGCSLHSRVDPYISLSHRSNLFDGGDEPTADRLALGGVISFDAADIDISHGIAHICLRGICDDVESTAIEARMFIRSRE